jgi:hypothetical protein
LRTEYERGSLPETAKRVEGKAAIVAGAVTG